VRVRLPFPLRGMDRSWPWHVEGDRSRCPFMRNMRAMNLAGQLTGGGRPGWASLSSSPTLTDQLSVASFKATDQDTGAEIGFWHQAGGSFIRYRFDNQTLRFDSGTGATGVISSQVGLTQLGDLVYWSADPSTGGTAQGYMTTTDGASATPTAWVATAGSLPTPMGVLCTYRGRIFGAAYKGQTWYCSRVGDARDWDYGADPVATSAQAGNTSAAGQPSDGIVAMIPWSDDYLLIFCQRSVWMMVGDPAAGGRVTLIMDEPGLADQYSWCWDEDGRLWTWTGNDLLAWSGYPPKPTSTITKRVYGFIGSSSGFAPRMNVAFDAVRRCVLVEPPDQSTFGLSYEIDTDTVSLVAPFYGTLFGSKTTTTIIPQYPLPARQHVLLAQSIIAVGYFGSGATEARMLGMDRRLSDDADGTSWSGVEGIVPAEIHLAPFTLPDARGADMESKVVELAFAVPRPDFWTGDGLNNRYPYPFTWRLYAGDSAQDVVLQDVDDHVATGIVFEGSASRYVGAPAAYQEHVGVSSAGVWHQLRLFKGTGVAANDENAPNAPLFVLGEIEAALRPMGARRVKA
jgi:hypothetical protein